MKSKIFVFIALILVGILFGITSCQDINNSNSATVTFNLDLSKIVKTSRNETSQNYEYILKVFAYNAFSYRNGSEIENLPLITKIENKVNANGIVKVTMNIEVGVNVIFVGKLYEVGAENPIYSGNSEVVKIKATDNKVGLVLNKVRDGIDINFELHAHTFAENWSNNATHHWKWATCGCDVVSEKAEHSFGIWEVQTSPTSEAEGTSKRTCSICNFEETKPIIVPECFVLIPAGTFQMGSTAGNNSDKPVHEVTITKAFFMGKYEVTQAEYEKYCSYTGSMSPSSSYGKGDNYPVYYVSWYDALVYCNERSIAEGLNPCYSISGNTDPSKWGTVPTSTNSTWDAVVCDWNANGYRLPTEAEWEYAARAGDNTVDAYTYAGTSDESKLGEYAWYTSNSSRIAHEVGTNKANAFGLYDMSGNVRELCWNWITSSYDTETEGGTDPTGASSGSDRVSRGGCWSDSSRGCIVFLRGSSYPFYIYNGLGFRVVRSVTTE